MSLEAIPAELMELYPDLERQLLPAIKATIRRKGAHRLRGVDMDDAIQEARMAILSAMLKYDFNKASGELAPYMKRVVANTCHALYGKSVQRQRAPRVPVLQDGEWKLAPFHPLSFDGLVESQSSTLEATEAARSTTPDAALGLQQSIMRVASFRSAMEQLLDDRERAVLECKLDPPADLVDRLEHAECPSNVDIGRHLGLNKAQIDWALYKIRNAFTEVASQERFSDVFADLIEGPGWPSISISRGQEYHAQFVQNALQARNLGGQIRTHEVESCALGKRSVAWYPWGAVVVVWRGDVCWTAVVEGQFNARSGEVSGRSGARKLLPIEGYNQLAKALADKRRFMVTTDYKLLPHCISEHEKGNEVCDGDGGDEPPCAHRDTCVALRLRMDEKNLKVTSYVTEDKDASGTPYCAPKNLAKFTKIIKRQIKAHGIKNGKATRKPKPPTSKGAAPAAVAKEVAATATEKIKPRSDEAIAMDGWFDRWRDIICENTGREFAERSPEVGQLFIKDRRAKSGYLGLYCKPAKGRPIGIALLHYKPRTQTMDLKYAVGPGDFNGVGKSVMKKLHPAEHNDGVFIAISKGLDETQVCLGAEAIAKLINGGSIQLPEAP